MKQRGSIAAMTVLILVGLFIGGIGGAFLTYEMRLRNNGIDVNAVIVGWEESYRTVEDSMGHQRQETSYFPVFSFQSEGRNIIQASNAGMDYETYTRHNIGDVMAVRWSADTDYLSWSDSIAGILIPSIVLCTGILCIILGIVFCRPRCNMNTL